LPFVAGKEIRREDEMSDLTSMIMMTPPSGALVVLGLLMALRVVRALQKTPVRSRQAIGSRKRPNGI
jgi:hypothetical protein